VPGPSIVRLIRRRRSVRRFLPRALTGSAVRKILDAGRWAPSGLNNQPWRFVVVRNTALKDAIARCTEYSFIIKGCPCVLLVYLDKRRSYHLLKDAQAIGACIQNMLLCACELGVGSCWMGEILNQKRKVNALLRLGGRYELMAAVALGYGRATSRSRRTSLRGLLIKEYR